MGNIFIYKIRQMIPALYFQQSCCESGRKVHIKNLMMLVTEVMMRVALSIVVAMNGITQQQL